MTLTFLFFSGISRSLLKAIRRLRKRRNAIKNEWENSEMTDFRGWVRRASVQGAPNERLIIIGRLIDFGVRGHPTDG